MTNTTSALVSPAATPVISSDTFFAQRGVNFFLKEKASETPYDKLPPGNYAIQFHPMMGYFLEKIADFRAPPKLYGNVKQISNRVLKSFQTKSNNLGIILSGLKGAGKTLQGRDICMEAAALGMPTLFVTSKLTDDDFMQFLNKIQQECVIFIDEFEKIYDTDSQQKLLTLLDGMFQSKKLFLLTCNAQHKVDSHLKNRPGRVHYHIEYGGLKSEFVTEFCEDNLNDKSKIKEVVSVCSLFDALNFDMLQTIVWEMNLYKESAPEALKLLNAKPEISGEIRYSMTVEIPVLNKTLDGKADELCNDTSLGNPLLRNTYLRLQFKEKDYAKEVWANIKKTYKLVDDPDQDEDDIKAEGKYYIATIAVKPENLKMVDQKTGNYIFETAGGERVVFSKIEPKKVDFDQLYHHMF